MFQNLKSQHFINILLSCVLWHLTLTQFPGRSLRTYFPRFIFRNDNRHVPRPSDRILLFEPVVGAQRSTNEPFLVASSPPQENARANARQGRFMGSGCAGGGTGHREASLQVGRCGSCSNRRPGEISGKIPGNPRRFPEIHIWDSRKSPGVESMLKLMYKVAFPEIPANPREFKKVTFRQCVEPRKSPEVFFVLPGNPRELKTNN
jgi:hypothetical protein